MNKQDNNQLKLLVALVVLFIYSKNLSAQIISDIAPLGSRSSSLGSSYVSLTDFWSSLNNPANIAATTNTYQVGVYYENSYLIKELNLSSIAVCYTNKYLALGGYLSRYGISSYNQGDAAILLGKNISSNIRIGAKIIYHYYQVANGDLSAGGFTGEVGISAKLSKHFLVGVHAINPTQEHIGNETKDQLPAALVIGCSYLSPWGIDIFGDIKKRISDDLSFHIGIEWLIYQRFAIRTGYQNSPNQFSLGIGYKAKSIEVDLSLTKHPTLGYSPQIATSLWFTTKKHPQP